MELYLLACYPLSVSVTVDERVVPPGSDECLDEAWDLKERIRAEEDLLKQRRGFFANAYRRSTVYCFLDGDDMVGFAAARSDAGVFNTTQNGEMRYYQVSNTGFASSGALTAQVMTLTDVTDRETYRQQLESKTEQLEALNRLVRHDIRNDMAVIHGWASVLEDHVDEEGEDALERVLHKSQHVIDFTETLRVFVDSLTGDSSVDVEPVDLREYLETELTAVRESYPDARIQMEGGVPETAVRANELLASVFRNITENAVEHSDEATPTVHVTCTEQGDTVHIRFADNGPGIPDDRKESIFGKGEKGLESGGSGIGLYLVATLTEQFGGQVWVEDNEPKGAVFVVELRTADGAE